MDDPRLRPWELKHHFRETSACYSLEIEMDGGSQQLEVEVKNEIAHLNEAHVLVRKSTIKGAQEGCLFVKETRSRPNHLLITRETRRRN